MPSYSLPFHTGIATSWMNLKLKSSGKQPSHSVAARLNDALAIATLVERERERERRDEVSNSSGSDSDD